MTTQSDGRSETAEQAAVAEGADAVTPADARPDARPDPLADAPVLISARGVSKRFASYQRRATSLKERLVRREQSESDVFWALRGIDVDVRSGETVGLMGPNGSGKSTLLKVLSGILRPNEGTVNVVGRVASLLELGAGFDGELTGRENIYLNAALLGVPREETERLFDEIVEFSELGEFIEYPVKHYSSGMYVRLGFAVAVHIDPDILIVDEVLAVGDAAFQKKCLTRIADFQKRGKTILFVSHSAGLIEELCTRAVVLSHGQVVFDGRPGEGVTRLNAIMGVDRSSSEEQGWAAIQDMRVLDPATSETLEEFHSGASVLVTATVTWNHELPTGAKISLHLTPSNSDETAVQVEPVWQRVPQGELDRGVSEVSWVIDALPDLPGTFTLHLGVFTDEVLIASARIGGVRIEGSTAHTASGMLRFGGGQTFV